MSDATAIDFNAVSPDMRAHINATLAGVERENDVTILFAAESGSRAWGFASPDSDYDVRFIYAHPADWYTGLYEARDVIERPLDERDVDLAGWDVRKALRLLLKSNPPLYEWLVSPIIYIDNGRFSASARALFEQHASPHVLANAYYAIARGHRPGQGVRDGEVKLKRYFYLVRPLLSLQWVVEHGTMPPMNLQGLMQNVDVPADVCLEIQGLLAKKSETPELGFGPRVPVIDAWAAAELERLAPDRLQLSDHQAPNTLQAATALFRRTVGL